MKNNEIIQKISEHSILIQEIRDDVRAIRDNHLPHMEAEIGDTRKRIDWVMGLIIAGVVFPLLFLFFKEVF